MPATTVDWNELLARHEVQTLVRLALEQDIGAGDVTTEAVFDGPQPAVGWIISRSKSVVCGLPLARAVMGRVDSALDVRSLVPEGTEVAAGTALMEIRGDIRSLLAAERCALNFLMRLGGIATNTRSTVNRIPADARTKIYDTRKTTPGWRTLDKAAVRTGGGENHRFGLHDAVLIKDNHIAAAGSVSAAITRAKATGLPVEVEIDGLDQLDAALDAGPDIVLLDNFGLDMLREAVSRTGDRAELEASGGITPEVIADVASTGVHRISLGALTHTVVPADLALDVSAGVDVERLVSVESTMLEARSRAQAGAPEGTTIVAASQTAGRGRRGRSWFSAPGAGLWMTTVLRPTRNDYPTLSLLAGAAVLEAARQLGASSAQLKWPNDILVNGKKLAGVLLEADTVHGEPVVLLGVGFNVQSAQELDLPEDIRERYVGLRDLVTGPVDVDAVLNELLPIVQRRYLEWCVAGLEPTLRTWSAANALAGARVRAEIGEGTVEGVVDGLESDGALRLKTDDGVVRVTTGEIIRLR